MRKGVLFLFIFCLWLIIVYNLSVDYIALKVFAQIEEPQQSVLDKKQQKLKTQEQENALKQAEKILKAKKQAEKRQAQLKQKEELAKQLAEKNAAQQRGNELAQQKLREEQAQKQEELKDKQEALALQKAELAQKEFQERQAKQKVQEMLKEKQLRLRQNESAKLKAEQEEKAKKKEQEKIAQLKQKEELAKQLAEKNAAQQRESELAQQRRQQELSQKEQESKAKKEELARQRQEQLKKQEEEKLAQKQQMQKKAAQKKTAEKKEESVLPPKEPSPLAEAEKEKPPIDYIIAEGDAIEVFVWQNPDLTKSVSVGPDGKISYPLVGRLQAAGLTIEQLESEIRKRISKFVKYPQVSIMMTGYAGNKVIILGEVNSPAVYTFKGSLNLIEAIAMAGDFTGKAQQDSVIVVRGNLTEQPKAFKINMTHVIKKGTSRTDIVLQPNDVIYVSRSLIHDVDKFLANFSNIISNGRKILDLRKDIMNRLILER